MRHQISVLSFVLVLFAAQTHAFNLGYTMVQHPVKFTFVRADGSPAIGMRVVNHEEVVRMMCRGLFHEVNCKTKEARAAESLSVTDANGQVEFIYDFNEAFTRTGSAESRVMIEYRDANGNLLGTPTIEYKVELRNVSGKIIRCVAPLPAPYGTYIQGMRYDSSELDRNNEFRCQLP